MQRLRRGYLGPAGSFCQQAALAWNLGSDGVELIPCPDLEDVFEGVNNDTFDQGVVPIENSLEGSVPLTLDLLAASQQQIQGEIVIPVHHHLVSMAKDLSEVKAIYSHSHVPGQCRRFLRRYWPGGRIEIVSSTALAAKLAREKGKEAAAIASALAADLYQLSVLYECIEDFPDNATRFIVMGRGRTAPTGNDKTSILMTAVKDHPGALYDLLGPFAGLDINLMRIESRPGKKRLGEYIFFIDCQGHADVEPLTTLLKVLKARAGYVKVLGSYPCFEAASGTGGEVVV